MGCISSPIQSFTPTLPLGKGHIACQPGWIPSPWLNLSGITLTDTPSVEPPIGNEDQPLKFLKTTAKDPLWLN